MTSITWEACPLSGSNHATTFLGHVTYAPPIDLKWFPNLHQSPVCCPQEHIFLAYFASSSAQHKKSATDKSGKNWLNVVQKVDTISMLTFGWQILDSHLTGYIAFRDVSNVKVEEKCTIQFVNKNLVTQEIVNSYFGKFQAHCLLIMFLCRRRQVITKESARSF